jgi:hypothetical protein
MLTQDEFYDLCLRVAPALEPLITHRLHAHASAVLIGQKTALDAWMRQTPECEDTLMLRAFLHEVDTTGICPWKE